MTENETVGIVGAGLMGTGIAEVTAAAGYPTVVVKATPGGTDSARSRVEKSLGKQVEKGKLSAESRDAILGRITWTADRIALTPRGRLVSNEVFERFLIVPAA